MISRTIYAHATQVSAQIESPEYAETVEMAVDDFHERTGALETIRKSTDQMVSGSERRTPCAGLRVGLSVRYHITRKFDSCGRPTLPRTVSTVPYLCEGPETNVEGALIRQAVAANSYPGAFLGVLTQSSAADQTTAVRRN